MHDDNASRRLTRRWQVLVILSAAAVMTVVLVQCGSNAADTATENTIALPPLSSSTTSSTAPPTTEPPSTEPPTTAPPPTFPPLPADMADPKDPGVIFEHHDLDIADSSIIWDAGSGQYWLYATNFASMDPAQNRNVQLWNSPNMRDWTLVGDAMPRMPAWAQPRPHLGSGDPPLRRPVGAVPDRVGRGERAPVHRVRDGVESRRAVRARRLRPADLCSSTGTARSTRRSSRTSTSPVWIMWKSEENAFPGGIGPTHIYSQRARSPGCADGDRQRAC